MDFHWTVNGETFDYGIPGGDCASLRDLLPALEIVNDDPETEANELDDFMAAIADVTFSDPGLVLVNKIEENTTVGALRAALEVESEYSAALTDEQRGEIDARALTAPDWALFSLKPFTSDETLTVAMTNGDSFAIAVTDAQIATRVIAADGTAYRITLEFGPEAGIPLDATLQAREIEQGSDEWNGYALQAMEALDGRAPDSANRFFDIEIWADGVKIEPAASVNVNIALDTALETGWAQKAYEVVHFGADGTVVMDSEARTAEIDGSLPIVTTDIRFDADSFSVYGIITVPTSTPSNVNDLDGRTFKIKGTAYNGYMTSTEIKEEKQTAKFGKTQSANEAAVWQFESAGQDGTYYITTISEGTKKYLRLNRHAGYLAHAGLSDAPQGFRVQKDGDNYLLSSIAEKNNGSWRYYLYEAYSGFLGTMEGSQTYESNGQTTTNTIPDNTCKLVLEFQDPETTKDDHYMLVVKYKDSYYVIHNDGTLVRVEDPTQVGHLKIDDPMVWQYNSNDNLYHRAKETGFKGNNLASDFFYRYIDPDVESGLTDEDETTTTLYKPSNGAQNEYYVQDGSRVLMNYIKIIYANHRISSQTNPFHYIGVVSDGKGGLKIAGMQTEEDAAEIYFVKMTEETDNMIYDHNAANDIYHTVNHIDIAVSGDAAFSVPLAYGTYYYKDNSGTVHTLVVSRDHQVTVDIKREIEVSRDDVKRANVSAYVIENGQQRFLDNVFYISGYSGNNESVVGSDNQTRIEGVFKVANLRKIDKNKTSGDQAEWVVSTGYVFGKEISGPHPSEYIMEQRLANKIYYTVSTTKKIDFDLEYNGFTLFESKAAAAAYDKDDPSTKVNVASSSATVKLSQTFDYWDSRNECPAIYVVGRFSPYFYPAPTEQAGLDNRWYWRHGGINFGYASDDGSGMDFKLGTVDKQAPGLLAIEITKFIVDESGRVIETRQDVDNVFHVYHKTENGHAPDSDVHSVERYNVGKHGASGFTPSEYTPSGYSYIHDRTTTVSGGGGIGVVYDYDFRDGGMVYIEEDTSEENLPRNLVDVYGKVWDYQDTWIETEYVWRDDGIENQRHISRDYDLTAGSNGQIEKFNSIPEVLGAYKDINGVSCYNGFLEFFVYNVYTTKKIDVPVKKEWKHENGTVAEAPENATVKVRLGRYMLGEDETHRVYGKLQINHTVTGLAENDSYYAAYKVKQGKNVVRAGSYDTGSLTIDHLPAGTYTLELYDNPGKYTASTTMDGQNVKKLSVDIQAVDAPTVVNIATNLTSPVTQNMVNVVVTNSLTGAQSGQDGSNYQLQVFSFPAPEGGLSDEEIEVTISRPGPSYNIGGNDFSAYIYTNSATSYSNNAVPWPEASEYGNVFHNVDQKLRFKVRTTDNDGLHLYFQHNWRKEDFWIKQVTLVDNSASSSGSDAVGDNTDPVGWETAESEAPAPASHLPGMVYIDDVSWEGVEVTLGNGKWEDVVKDLDGVDAFGNKYLYYIKTVTEEGMPAGVNWNPTIAMDADGHVLASDGETTLRVTNTVPNEKPIVTIRKVDDNGQPLKGAMFRISGDGGNTFVDLNVNAAGTIFTTGELEEGSYIIRETAVPTGYREIGGDVIAFTVSGKTITDYAHSGNVQYNEGNYTFTVVNNPTVTNGKLKVLKKWQDFNGNEIAPPDGVVANMKLIQVARRDRKVTVEFWVEGNGSGGGNENEYKKVATREKTGYGTAKLKLKWNEHTTVSLGNSDPTAGVTEITVEGCTKGKDYDFTVIKAEKPNAEIEFSFYEKGDGINTTYIVKYKNNKWMGFEDSALNAAIEFDPVDLSEQNYTATHGYREFQLNSGNNWSKEFTVHNTSDALLTNGEGDLPAYYNGKPCRYLIVEAGVPAGFTVSYSNNNAVGIGAGETGTLTAYNRKATTNIELVKVDKDNHSTKLAGAEFKIYKINPAMRGVVYMDWTDNETHVTGSEGDALGKTTFNNLSVGYYEIQETKAPNTQYKIIGDGCFFIKVTNDGVFVIEKDLNKSPDMWRVCANDSMVAVNEGGGLTVGNAPYKFDLEIIKVDSLNRETLLANAGFTMYRINEANPSNTEGDPILPETNGENHLTGSDGKAWFRGLRSGYYKVKETAIPDGYGLTSNGEFFIRMDQGVVTLGQWVLNDGTYTFQAIDATGDNPISLVTTPVTQDEEPGDESVTSYTATVGNQPGVKLPSTGGPGTTPTYVAGGLITLLALALLIAKRRIC